MNAAIRTAPGAALALASAALFGASTPLAKLLLGSVDPWLLAGLLYLGSGIGLALLHGGRIAIRVPPTEAPLRRADLPWLTAVVLCGGGIGPVLLMVGLAHTEASSAALLLNLEGVATIAIARVAFGEDVDRRILLGASAILAGALLLSWQSPVVGIGWGAFAIAGACVAWGIDNNLTRKLSSADPVHIAITKGIVAGAVNLAIALAKGAAMPAPGATLGAGMVGFFGYGVSLVLFVLALRHLGTARTGAYFSAAPFIGAALAITIFDEPITTRLILAATLIGIGVYLHLTERHAHQHAHKAAEHEHRHVHDKHHQHVHGDNDPPGEPHVHLHRHVPMIHGHRHFPDIHHPHRHAS